MAVMIGYFANLALPRLGEVTRCGVLARYEKIPFQKSFGTVVTERAIDLISLMIIFILTFVIHLDKFAQFKNTTIIQNMLCMYYYLENPSFTYYLTAAFFLVIFIILFRLRHKISHNSVYIKIKEIILGFVEGLKSLARINKPFCLYFIR
jgi:hypothetical protein